MIYIDKNTYIPRVEETLETLRMHNNQMPQFVDFDKVMMYINYFQLKIKEVSKDLFFEIGKPQRTDAASNMKGWLIRNADTSGFKMEKTGMSLSEASIEAAIESGTLDKKALELLDLYRKYSSYTKSRGTMISLLQNPISNAPSCDGHRMLILNPLWVAQNTGRVGMHNPAVQNFPRQLQDIQTVPRGYIYQHTDSGQIEPRETYSHYLPDEQIRALILLYNDAYYGILHYVTMPEEYILSGRTDFVKMEITEEMKNNRKKIKTYSNAVMYGSKSNPSGDPIKAAMIKRIGEHPLRKKWLAKLSHEINKGTTLFPTAFGTLIDISKSPKLVGDLHSENIEEQMLKLAINNPIQGTAADLMRVSVSEANKLMMNKGKKSYIINYVHDAGSFCIHEDDWDKIGDELGDIVSYQVEGWLPITAEPEVGRNKGKAGLIEDLY